MKSQQLLVLGGEEIIQGQRSGSQQSGGDPSSARQDSIYYKNHDNQAAAANLARGFCNRCPSTLGKVLPPGRDFVVFVIDARTSSGTSQGLGKSGQWAVLRLTAIPSQIQALRGFTYRYCAYSGAGAGLALVRNQAQ